MSFSIYQKAKYTYDDWITKATGNSPLVHANYPGAWPSLSTMLCFGGAGATSGSVITALSCAWAPSYDSVPKNPACFYDLFLVVFKEKGLTIVYTGPFELTKLNAQIAVLMERGVDKHNSFECPEAKTSSSGKKAAPTAGTFRTAKMIIRQRGVLGLYSGFHLHLRESPRLLWPRYCAFLGRFGADVY